MSDELQNAVDVVCLNCTQDTLNNEIICENCPVRKTVNDLQKTDNDSSDDCMKVSELIELLKDENPDSNVYGVDWSNRNTYKISVGRITRIFVDDEDMRNDVYIQFDELFNSMNSV